MLNKKILIVEDDAAILEALSMTFQTAGYFCLTACCGKTALKLIDQYHPDLVVLDYLLPDITGLKIAQKLNYERNKAKVIFVTARTGCAQLVNQGLANAFIQKPFEICNLLRIVKHQFN